jgi:hypothetical protein
MTWTDVQVVPAGSLRKFGKRFIERRNVYGNVCMGVCRSVCDGERHGRVRRRRTTAMARRMRRLHGAGRPPRQPCPTPPAQATAPGHAPSRWRGTPPRRFDRCCPVPPSRSLAGGPPARWRSGGGPARRAACRLARFVGPGLMRCGYAAFVIMGHPRPGRSGPPSARRHPRFARLSRPPLLSKLALTLLLFLRSPFPSCLQATARQARGPSLVALLLVPGPCVVDSIHQFRLRRAVPACPAGAAPCRGGIWRGDGPPDHVDAPAEPMPRTPRHGPPPRLRLALAGQAGPRPPNANAPDLST